MRPPFTVEERATRFQRRYTGPWRTVGHEVGPIEVRYRYRRRMGREFVELAVAGHDLWTHAVWRGLFVPALTPVARWLALRLDSHEKADGPPR